VIVGAEVGDDGPHEEQGESDCRRRPDDGDADEPEQQAGCASRLSSPKVVSQDSGTPTLAELSSTNSARMRPAVAMKAVAAMAMIVTTT